jgi:hypothetical protein
VANATGSKALLRWVPLIGAAISFALSVILAFLVEPTALLGVVIGLTGTILALQVESLLRLQASNNLVQILAEIASPAERATFESMIMKMSIAAARAVARSDSFVTVQSKRTIDEATYVLQELTAGRIRRPQHDNMLLLECIRECRSSLKATTDPRDLIWWKSIRGRQFLDANIASIRDRGVRVDRIFYSDGSPEFMQLIEEQRRSGITCHVIDHASMDLDDFANITIFDDRIMHRDEYGPKGATTYQLFSSDDRDVTDALRNFDSLRRAALPTA